MSRCKNLEWWCTRLLPLFSWSAAILWIASRPKSALFAADVKTVLGLPREWLQYPYHFTAFFILAILFRRCLPAGAAGQSSWRAAAFSFLGCALVSLCSEGLQFYVPTRTPAVRDLAVDQFAAVFGLALTRIVSDKLFRLG
jgi:hypothetical protein